MKNYLYKFELLSGFYENIFYKEIKATDEKDAIIQILAGFKDWDIDSTKEYLDNYFKELLTEDERNDTVKNNWSLVDFWEKFDRKIFSENCHEAYLLMDVKEIDFELSKL
jgi:hypothetical protein